MFLISIFTLSYQLSVFISLTHAKGGRQGTRGVSGAAAVSKGRDFGSIRSSGGSDDDYALEFFDCVNSRGGNLSNIDENDPCYKMAGSDFMDDGDWQFEKRIKYRLLGRFGENYDKTSRPVMQPNDTINVFVGISLFHILETNEKSQTITTLLSVRLKWVDQYLVWNSTQFGGVEKIWMPAESIWRPDVVISNSAGRHMDEMSHLTNAIIESNGRVLWMYPVVVTTYCTLDVRFFPFDHQDCPLRFISWTYSGYELNLHYSEAVSYYQEVNQEWKVLEIEAKRKVSKYACCPEPYPEVAFGIHMKRRSTFYLANMIAPCLLIYLVSLLGFFIPVESADKINLEITILLAMIVFLMIVGETLPPTPESVPLLGQLVGIIMLWLAVALVFCVIVTNCYYYKDGYTPPAPWLRALLCSDKSTHDYSFCRLLDCLKSRQKEQGTQSYALPNHTIGNRLPMAGHTERLLDGVPGSPAVIRNKGPVGYELYDLKTTTSAKMSSQDQLNNSLDGEEVDIFHSWMTIAKKLDSIFFWVYTSMSTLSIVLLFISVPYEMHD